mmetsp:Transcript_14962/g.28077  ORF Transcript_14962/g.28077 Transcript_14962/m.28077 type:complete len:223 (+) Transcript_14962:83-751(+)
MSESFPRPRCYEERPLDKMAPPRANTPPCLLPSAVKENKESCVSNSACNDNIMNQRTLSKKRASNNQQGKSRKSGRHRLWQLPESSIADYARWIQEKPELEQTPAERQFLWKYMMRTLGVRRNKEKTRDFVERLRAKPEITAMEEQFIRHFQRRRECRRKHNGKITDPSSSSSEVIWWERSTTVANSGGLTTASLANLRESMMKLGLSSDKLKHTEDTSMHT